MPLSGQAAMLLAFDITPDAIDEHDHWHTHEHLPERLAIPGFLRGSRWTAVDGQPGYMVLYEVQSLQTLVSPAYLQRLNNPSAWTTKMMPSYRGMSRGLCEVVASCGVGMGHFALVLRFDALPADKPALRQWLSSQVLPQLPMQPGLGGAHLLEAAAQAPMTNEQRIRGADAGVACVVLVMGYSLASLRALASGDLAPARLHDHGATGVSCAFYQTAYTLLASEV